MCVQSNVFCRCVWKDLALTNCQGEFCLYANTVRTYNQLKTVSLKDNNTCIIHVVVAVSKYMQFKDFFCNGLLTFGLVQELWMISTSNIHCTPCTLHIATIILLGSTYCYDIGLSQISLHHLWFPCQLYHSWCCIVRVLVLSLPSKALPIDSTTCTCTMFVIGQMYAIVCNCNLDEFLIICYK